MKKKLILGILVATSVLTLVGCGKKNEPIGTNVSIGNTNDIKEYEKEKENDGENDKSYENITFDDFIYSEYKGQNNENSNLQESLNYYFNDQYDSSYTEKERLEVKNISENITQALFYGDTYKEKDETLDYVLSFVDDEKLRDDVKVIFEGKFCELIGATYYEDTVKYNKDTIWSGEGYQGNPPYISTQWTIKYSQYDKYDVKKDGGYNQFDLTFIKKDGRWILTEILTK